MSGYKQCPFIQIALSCPSLCPLLDKSEYNSGRRQLARPFLKIVPLRAIKEQYSWEIRRRAVDRRRHEFRLVPPGDSASQNVRILKHDKHSEITIRATLGYEPRRQTGEFLTLHDPWANLGCTRTFSRVFSRCANPCRVN